MADSGHNGRLSRLAFFCCRRPASVSLHDRRGSSEATKKLRTSSTAEEEEWVTPLPSQSAPRNPYPTAQRAAAAWVRGEPGSYIYSVAGIRGAQSGPRVRGARIVGTKTTTLFVD